MVAIPRPARLNETLKMGRKEVCVRPTPSGDAAEFRAKWAGANRQTGLRHPRASRLQLDKNGSARATQGETFEVTISDNSCRGHFTLLHDRTHFTLCSRVAKSGEVQTLYNTGARVSEMTGLQKTQVHFGTKSFVRFKGKGRKERAVPLWSSTSRTLRTWFEELDSDARYRAATASQMLAARP